MREVCPEARFLSGLLRARLFGKVREVPQTRRTPFYPARPTVWPRPTALHHGELPRVLRPHAVSGILFNHESASAAGVRNPQDLLARRRDQARAGDRARLGNLDASGTGATPRITSTRCGGCCSRRTAGLCDRDGRGPFRAGVRSSRLRQAGISVGDHVVIDPAFVRPPRSITWRRLTQGRARPGWIRRRASEQLIR